MSLNVILLFKNERPGTTITDLRLHRDESLIENNRNRISTRIQT